MAGVASHPRMSSLCGVVVWPTEDRRRSVGSASAQRTIVVGTTIDRRCVSPLLLRVSPCVPLLGVSCGCWLACSCLPGEWAGDRLTPLHCALSPS